MSGLVRQGRAGRLTENDAFRIRMENQCEEIEQYRLAVLRKDDRVLSPDEAALEWIERYAAAYDRRDRLRYE